MLQLWTSGGTRCAWASKPRPTFRFIAGKSRPGNSRNTELIIRIPRLLDRNEIIARIAFTDIVPQVFVEVLRFARGEREILKYTSFSNIHRERVGDGRFDTRLSLAYTQFVRELVLTADLGMLSSQQGRPDIRQFIAHPSSVDFRVWVSWTRLPRI